MPQGANGDKPNVLLICTDHWSGLLTGSAGHPVVMTPTIDQLARAGTTYRNAYSACPSCIPARRSMFTGMSPRANGLRHYLEGALVGGEAYDVKFLVKGDLPEGSWIVEEGVQKVRQGAPIELPARSGNAAPVASGATPGTPGGTAAAQP